MKSLSRIKPEDSGDEVYIDPVFTAENRHLEKKFDLLSGFITPEEVSALKEFIEAKLPNTSESPTSQTSLLPYRPDEWDALGVIQKIQDTARAHINAVYSVSGQLEPRKFLVMRTDNCQNYSENYGLYNDNNEILYTVVASVSHPEDYYSGETLYPINGEGFRPMPGYITIHRNESLNNWEILEVLSGIRFDLVIVFQEIDRQISYDYQIDETEVDLDF